MSDGDLTQKSAANVVCKVKHANQRTGCDKDYLSCRMSRTTKVMHDLKKSKRDVTKYQLDYEH